MIIEWGDCTAFMWSWNGTARRLLWLLNYSMAQSHSWEANRFAASQEIPRISRNPKVHCRTHKRPPAVTILGQPKPVHIPTSHLLQIHPNIIHPSMPRSPQWCPSSRFSSLVHVRLHLWLLSWNFAFHQMREIFRPVDLLALQEGFCSFPLLKATWRRISFICTD